VALSDGSIVDDSLLDESFEQSLLNGLAGLGENVPVQNIQKEKVKMQICIILKDRFAEVKPYFTYSVFICLYLRGETPQTPRREQTFFKC
jgi:hypothetical protein